MPERVPDRPEGSPPEAPRLSEAVVRLDDAFRRLRRWMHNPPSSARLEEFLREAGGAGFVDADPAKVAACEVVSTLREDGPVTVGDVAEALALERSTASRLLGDCERLGLVARTHDPADRRRVLLGLTDRGELLAEQSAGVRRRVMAQLVADWDAADLDHFLARFEVLADRIGGVVAEVVAGRVPPELERALREPPHD